MSIFKKAAKTEYNAEKKNKMINYEHLNTHYCRKNQTVLAGDSITEILNHTELYADYINQTGTVVYNRGISGDTSDRLLERFEKNVLNINPKNIVLLIGTNDFGYGLTMNDTVENVDKMLSDALKKCPDTNIILQSVYPVNTEMRSYDKKKNKEIPVLNKRLKDIADKHGVTFVDLTDTLSDNNGNLKEKYTYDGLHPTVFGFEAAVSEIIPLLK